MTEALFRVQRAGPLSTIQDKGRFSFARYGVTEGGPMDRVAHRIGQHLVGNPPGAAGLEIDVQGLTLECLSGEIRLAFTGGDFAVTIGETSMHGWLLAAIRSGERVDIRPHRWGVWCYVALAGEILAPQWLGSHSVNPAWSVSGQPLKPGDEIRVKMPPYEKQAPRHIPVPVFARPRSIVHVIPGPQERYFTPESLTRLYSETFAISTQYNRQGIRLDGTRLTIASALDMPSEPIVRGAIQVDGSGQASVLMADHQTTGGYPKIATVISADIDRLAQLRPRQALHFTATTVDEALERLRRQRALLDAYLATLR